MSTKKSSNRRKALAVGIAIVGVAGLSLASAAQLNLVSDSAQFQAGVDDVTNCQPSTEPIAVEFATPTLTTSGYSSTAVVLTGINAACVGKHANLAIAGSTGSLTEIASAVVIPAVASPATTATLTVSLGATAADSVAKVALSIQN
jgi:hypothetical protein